MWDEEWREHALRVALDHVKREVKPDAKQKTATFNDAAFNLDFEPLLKDIPHTAPTLTITVRGAGTFAGTPDKLNPDEAFSVDNVKVIIHR